MRVAKVPAELQLTIDGVVQKYPWPHGYTFFFPEGKEPINLLMMREILKEMEKMEEENNG